MKKIHPLQAWIEANGLSLYSFARAHKLGMRALYNHVAGTAVPRVSTMMKIARATNRQVSVLAQMEWYQSQAEQ